MKSHRSEGMVAKVAAWGNVAALVGEKPPTGEKKRVAGEKVL